MRKLFVSALFVALLLWVVPNATLAQDGTGRHARGHVMTPKSSVEVPEDLGVNARTHLRMFIPADGFLGEEVQPAELPPFPGFFFETPASIACVYRLVPHHVPGCDPNVTTVNPSGGGGAIALVDAFDLPTAASDLDRFSKQFGLPTANFTVVFADGTRPAVDPSGGFTLEAALDIEWAHAMAPKAKIFLVESRNNSFNSLFHAVIVASNIVAANGGGQVSMSFGSGEFTQETLFDPIFTTPGVEYFASSGDSPGVSYPSASPNVISAGGTTLSRNSTTGRFLLENTWQDTGGGPSEVEPRPGFQDGVKHIVGDARGTPDVSFDANPATGVWVFNTNPVFGKGWFIVGGTSVSAPAIAGIFNARGEFRASSQALNIHIYSDLRRDSDDFRDIEFGNCGLNIGDFARDGWDFCTGVGSNVGRDHDRR